MTYKMIEYSDEMESREVIKLHEEGYQIICPKCKTRLDIAASPEEAIEKKIPRGITCPTNPKHVYIIFNFDRKSFWDKLHKKWEKDKSEK